MPQLIIEYITRFKVRYEKELGDLQRHPLSHPAIHELQLTRARRVVNAANALIAMGPNAMKNDNRKFETWRDVLFGNNIAFSKTKRQLRTTNAKHKTVSVNAPQTSERHR